MRVAGPLQFDPDSKDKEKRSLLSSVSHAFALLFESNSALLPFEPMLLFSSFHESIHSLTGLESFGY
jgi:hypothetical protein